MLENLPLLESCEGCGACCLTICAPPFRIDHIVNEPIERGVPQELIDELLPSWRIRHLAEASPCLWFDEITRTCRHYELRPTICRDFERNSPSCLAVRVQFGRTTEDHQ